MANGKSALSEHECSLLKLIHRSRDLGDGWKQCSEPLWLGLILPYAKLELVELNQDKKQVRLSEKGKVVVEYLA